MVVDSLNWIEITLRIWFCLTTRLRDSCHPLDAISHRYEDFRLGVPL